jgi:hypothetical protein
LQELASRLVIVFRKSRLPMKLEELLGGLCGGFEVANEGSEIFYGLGPSRDFCACSNKWKGLRVPLSKEAIMSLTHN